jgi:hypothetical protein
MVRQPHGRTAQLRTGSQGQAADKDSITDGEADFNVALLSRPVRSADVVADINDRPRELPRDADVQ